MKLSWDIMIALTCLIGAFKLYFHYDFSWIWVWSPILFAMGIIVFQMIFLKKDILEDLKSDQPERINTNE